MTALDDFVVGLDMTFDMAIETSEIGDSTGL